MINPLLGVRVAGNPPTLRMMSVKSPCIFNTWCRILKRLSLDTALLVVRFGSCFENNFIVFFWVLDVKGFLKFYGG
ncbi:hypothetical protein HQ585_08985 [candidate division KSB1 bacterium]|nr:hypothetical protein [candidate division KSB1 bacterium]